MLDSADVAGIVAPIPELASIIHDTGDRIADTDRVGKAWKSEVETRASPLCGDGRANLDCFSIFTCPGAVTILISTHLISLTAVLPNPIEFLIIHLTFRTYMLIPYHFYW